MKFAGDNLKSMSTLIEENKVEVSLPPEVPFIISPETMNESVSQVFTVNTVSDILDIGQGSHTDEVYSNVQQDIQSDVAISQGRKQGEIRSVKPSF